MYKYTRDSVDKNEVIGCFLCDQSFKTEETIVYLNCGKDDAWAICPNCSEIKELDEIAFGLMARSIVKENRAKELRDAAVSALDDLKEGESKIEDRG